ncbi:MAG: HAMP domain-containing sensor histidine kinase, partial [Bacteroidota bacterium]
MKWRQAPKLVALAVLSLAVLIFFQWHWLKQSRDLIEEQFDQKVSMALCMGLDEGNNQCLAVLPPSLGSLKENSLKAQLLKDPESIRPELTNALAYFDIHLDYEIRVLGQNEAACNPQSPYCCAVEPFASCQDQFVEIYFPGKTRYVLSQLWFMLFSSLLILLFMTGVLLWTIRAYLQQKRISEINVDFFNNMAHEFKTPLTNIHLAANRMQKKEQFAPLGPYTRIIKEESQKLEKQVERVLQLARLENGEYQLSKEWFDINALTQSAIADMHLQIEQKKAKVYFEEWPDDLKVYGDPFHLRHVFKNLIENSLKYCRRQPEIYIDIDKKSDGLSITFKDNGIGINKMDQQLIFEKFQRVNKGNHHDCKGFGIGLSYVKMIIERHQGAIRIHSDLNKGSHFELF